MNMSLVVYHFYKFAKMPKLGKICGKLSAVKQAVEHFAGGSLRRNHCVLLPEVGCSACGVVCSVGSAGVRGGGGGGGMAELDQAGLCRCALWAGRREHSQCAGAHHIYTKQSQSDTLGVSQSVSLSQCSPL